MIDCAAYIGQYPFRHLPHPEPDVLVRVLEREGLSGAWVGYLPSAWHRDPAPGNDALFAALAPYRQMLKPAPVVRPDWPLWEQTLGDLVNEGAAAIRAYPMQWGVAPHDATLRALALACGELGVPLVLTVRFEDLRQRHPLDVAGDLTAAHVRAREARGHRRRPRAARGGALGTHARGTAARALGFRLDLGTAGGSFRAPVAHRGS